MADIGRGFDITLIASASTTNSYLGRKNTESLRRKCGVNQKPEQTVAKETCRKKIEYCCPVG